ncbi:matrixin family metalloprotease [Marinobacter sp. F4216]|uniref:matrixin family metalloprotease n=1 Tax=Marinobacter sp. F4216 TaxID=2874281 RepID=UPI001CC1091F|nr:matrixin family metalloprotease [Marinobacter sp. F4216]MBZ2168122.1 matrixin family metalloprotease [Marinobacter sp. F4216]
MNRVSLPSDRFLRCSHILTVFACVLLSLPLFASEQQDGYRLLKLEGYLVKWGEQQLGTGARISYAFADETLDFENARNCGVLAPMRALSNRDLSFEMLVKEAAAAFRVWERAADLSFYRVANARDADIILGAQGQPHRRAFANVTFAPREKDGVRAISQSLVCLNPEQKWKIGFDGDTETYDIRYTLIHEIGHAIGLDHPGPSGQVMGFRYTENFPELQPGDLRGIRHLYGHRASDNQLANSSDSGRTESSL